MEHRPSVGRSGWGGDSTKTTLLDALGLVLGPSNNLPLTDADFYELDMSRHLLMEAVIAGLPDNLIKESQLGKDRSGLLHMLVTVKSSTCGVDP